MPSFAVKDRDLQQVQDYNNIIIIAFKGVIPDFLQSPHSAANCLQHVRSSGPGAILCNTSSAYHVQHVVLLATWYEGTAEPLSLTELKSHLFGLYFIQMKEGRKLECPAKTPGDEL